MQRKAWSAVEFGDVLRAVAEAMFLVPDISGAELSRDRTSRERFGRGSCAAERGHQGDAGLGPSLGFVPSPI